MTKSKHNQTLKTVILLLTVFLCFTETFAVSGERYASLSSAENSVSDHVSTPISNYLLSDFSDRNVVQYDTTGIVCPDDIATYTDLNSCVAIISTGLDLEDPENIIRALTWEMTGATEASSDGSGINQIGSYSFNEGTTVITYRGATLYNNSIYCTFTVTVSDNQVPRLENPQEDITVRADAGDCYAFVNWAEPIVSDNCASPDQILINGSHEPGTSFPVGETTVFYTINDGMEYNNLEHSFTVTVVDEEIPEIYAPANVTVSCGDPIPDAYTTWQQFEDAGGMAFDNCNIDFGSFKYGGQQSSGIRCPYTITRTYSITDSDGNVAEVEHLIYVGEEAEEEEAPVVLKSGMATFTAVQDGSWNDPATWGGSTYPQAGDVVYTGVYDVELTADAECSSITIDNGGSFFTAGSYTLSVSGDWTNNGTFNAGTYGNVEFVGATSTTIGGSSTTTFTNFELNKSSLSYLLEVNGSIVFDGDADGDILFTSGLMQINSGANVSSIGNAGFTIGTDAGIFVNGGAFSTGSVSIENEGLFRIDSGTADFGDSSGNGIVVRSSGTFDINGGTVNVAGRLEVSGG
ncbi:MAG TPA: HYR domain-containing protein, partial [Draconibacterium sp.]|nr:HYR domain-containing protein [Draconibacterium sp.]